MHKLVSLPVCSLMLKLLTLYAINNGKFRENLVQLFRTFSKVTLPFNPCADVLFWSESTDSRLSFSNYYEAVMFKKNSVACAKFVWSSFIPPRHSSLVWCMLYSRLSFETTLQIRGVSLASICRFCYGGPDCWDHPFVNCFLAQHIWQGFPPLLVLICLMLDLSNRFSSLLFPSISPRNLLTYGVWLISSFSFRFERLEIPGF